MEYLENYKNMYNNYFKSINEWKSCDRTIKYDQKIYQTDLFYRILYDNTKYIKYETLITGLKNCISSLDKNKVYTLFFPCKYPFKIGSENALVLECFDKLKDLNIKSVIIDYNNISDNDNILVIDDFIFTGRNIQHIVDTLNNYALDLNFTVVTYGSNDVIENKLLEKNKNIVFLHEYMFRGDLLHEMYENFLKSSQVDLTDETKNLVYYNIEKSLSIRYGLTLMYTDHKIHDSLMPLYVNMFDEDKFPTRYPSSVIELISGHNG